MNGRDRGLEFLSGGDLTAALKMMPLRSSWLETNRQPCHSNVPTP